jgi:hypothetical protein
MTLVLQGEGRAVAVSRAAPPLPSILHPFARRHVLRSERFQLRRDQNLAWRFQEVVTGLGLVAGQASIAASATISVPHVVQVHPGPPVTLVVKTLPHQLVCDYVDHATRIAQSMGVARVRFDAMGPSMIRVELLGTDPLVEAVALPHRSVHGLDDLIFLGTDETGTDYGITPVDLVHLIVQGATGSGKSVFVYGLLAQLATSPSVLIAMSDPTGLLTRPFADTVHSEWHVGGTADPDAHIDLLERLVQTMDQRIYTLPARRDQVDLGEGCPLMMIFLEEYPGLIRSATALDAGKKSGGRVERIKGLVGRLAAESRKAGMRLILLAQRAEASILDGYTRGQMTIKLSFRVAEATSVEMLHTSAGRGIAEEHAAAGPGIALLSGPGVPLARLKTPYVGCADDGAEYGRYWDLVTDRAIRLPVPILAGAS